MYFSKKKFEMARQGALRVACGLVVSVAGCASPTSTTDSVDEEVGTTNQALGSGNEAFQANTGKLWIDGADAGVAMYLGTSPATAIDRVFYPPINGYLMTNPCHAVRSSAGTLKVWRAGVLKDAGGAYGSPAVAITNDHRCIVAYQTGGHKLQTFEFGTNAKKVFGLSVDPNSNPSITADSPTSFSIAFRGSNGRLWTVNESGTSRDWGINIASLSSPSITATGAGIMIAYRGSNGNLWTVGESVAAKDWGLGIAARTSPSITNDPGNFVVAFNAAGTNRLWTVKEINGSVKQWSLVMAPNTSPSMASWKTGASWVLAQSSTGSLNVVDLNQNKITNRGLGMATGTSPAAN